MDDQFSTILNQCIEKIEKGDTTPEECIENYPEFRDELKDLLGVMQFIQTTSHVPVDQDFRWRTRASMVDKVVKYKPVSVWNKSQLWIREFFPIRSRIARMQIVLLLALLLSLLSGGSVLAAENAVPGDFFYPLKMIIEEIRITVFGEERDVELHLKFAERRLKEVESLAERGRFEGIGVAIDRFEYHIEGVTRPVPVEETHKDILRDWHLYEFSETISKHQEVLESLLNDEVIAEEARNVIEHAIEVSGKGKAKLNELFPDGPPGKPPLESIPVPDERIPRGEPDLPDLHNIPELPIELPFDPGMTPEKEEGKDIKLPEPAKRSPGRP